MAELPDFRIRDFQQNPGVDFYDMVRPTGSADEKQRLRRDARGSG